MKILMVCLGNICRSPLAEGILKEQCKKKNLNWVIESAGTAGYHVGSAPHHQSQKVALQHQIDISEQRCRKFVKEDMDRFDLIFAMDHQNYIDIKQLSEEKWDTNKVKLILNEVHSIKNKDVPDPWNGTDKDFLYTFQLLEIACESIINNYCAFE